MNVVCLNQECSLHGIRQFDGNVWLQCPGCLQPLYGMRSVIPIWRCPVCGETLDRADGSVAAHCAGSKLEGTAHERTRMVAA